MTDYTKISGTEYSKHNFHLHVSRCEIFLRISGIFTFLVGHVMCLTIQFSISQVRARTDCPTRNATGCTSTTFARATPPSWITTAPARVIRARGGLPDVSIGLISQLEIQKYVQK